MSKTQCKVIIPKIIRSLPEFRALTPSMQDNTALFCHAVLAFSGTATLEGRHQQIAASNINRLVEHRKTQRIRRLLHSWDILLNDGVFSYRNEDHLKAIGYRFSDSITKTDFCKWSLQTEPSIKRYKKFIGSSQPAASSLNGTALPHHRTLLNRVAEFRIDESAAQDVLKKLPACTLPSAQHAVSRLRNQQFYLIRGVTGRIYTPITNLKKELRPCLYWGKDPSVDLCLIDASCMQPLLLCILMNGTVSVAELSQYQELCEAGQLYEQIAADTSLTRAQVKLAMLTYLCGPWFDPNSEDQLSKCSAEEWACLQSVSKWFLSAFPEVSQYLREEKTNGQYYKIFNTRDRIRKGLPTQPYVIISHRMQRLESCLMIDQIAKEVMLRCKQMPFTTIHDAYLIAGEEKSNVQKILSQGFERQRIKPQFKIETI